MVVEGKKDSRREELREVLDLAGDPPSDSGFLEKEH